MSKPVSNSDVEDVLSSIRRLVSDNKAQAGTDAGLDRTDRLVLSPQHRVEDLGVLRLRPEDAVDAKQGLQDDSTPETPPVDDATAEDETTPPQDTEAAEDATTKDPFVSLNDEAFEAPEGDEAPHDAAQVFGVNELTAKIAALETAIAKTSDQWEPDGAGRDAYAGTQSKTMTWQDSVDLDAKGTPLPPETGESDKTADAAKPLSDVPVEEQLLDEDALRDLVAEIVRSELQGALGERITRNVRKLVRREIHRALAAQDLQ
ncbi:hypothetical protein [uncultured Roseobacter sp.]|uniref:hypothetical protein n=1 Tax=uncultured Roseobacter sp. TaxID=114847 RepID=UPI00261CA82B|nr:hypothetical protein [uncultured Roseobacter sp.]